jgi:hypothetical protein
VTTKPGENRTEEFVEAVTGAMNSIAALVEQAQAKLPFYVETHVSQTFVSTTAAQTYTVSPNPLAAQLVRVTGLVAVAFGTSASEVGATVLQLGNNFALPVPQQLATTVSQSALVLPACSYFLDTISQGVVQGAGNLKLTCVAGDTHNLSLALWLWGEMVPATGMVG